MKIMELVEFAGNSKNKMLKTDQLQQVVAKEIETKEYISIKDKKVLINNIIESCVRYEDGMFKFDDVNKYITFTMGAIAAYTNLELSDDIEEDYDSLCRAKLLNVVINTFSGEYENLNLLFQMRCDYVLSNNGIEAQVGRFLSSILERIDNFVEAAANFDISKLPVSMEDLNKLMEFVNSQSK